MATVRQSGADADATPRAKRIGDSCTRFVRIKGGVSSSRRYRNRNMSSRPVANGIHSVLLLLSNKQSLVKTRALAPLDLAGKTGRTIRAREWCQTGAPLRDGASVSPHHYRMVPANGAGCCARWPARLAGPHANGASCRNGAAPCISTSMVRDLHHYMPGGGREHAQPC
jgi:hypothetical protein